MEDECPVCGEHYLEKEGFKVIQKSFSEDEKVCVKANGYGFGVMFYYH